MFVTRFPVRAVSGFRPTLINHTITSRLVSKPLGSYPLQQSRQLRLTAEYQPDRQGTAVPRARKKKEDDVKVLEAKLAQKDEEIEELKTAIHSILAPLNELVKQRRKRKLSENPDGEPNSKKRRVTPSNNNLGHDNSQGDQTEYSPATSTVTGYLHR